MFLALLLSGFFLRPRWWIKALLAVYILPWAIAAAQACISFHWMLIREQGLIDGVLSALFGIEGPIWFNDRWLGLGSNIVAYIWKWMPFWTVIFLAARMRIPRDIYDSAEVDGATGTRRFVHVTFPLLANLYLLCTLLSTLWTLGDFTTVYLVSGGGPAGSTDVLATLGFHYAFDTASPALGVAAVMSALPVLIPVVILTDAQAPDERGGAMSIALALPRPARRPLPAPSGSHRSGLGDARHRHPDLVADARLQHVSDRARSRRRGNRVRRQSSGRPSHRSRASAWS